MSTENYLLLILYLHRDLKILSKTQDIFLQTTIFFQQALKHFLRYLILLFTLQMLKAFGRIIENKMKTKKSNTAEMFYSQGSSTYVKSV